MEYYFSVNELSTEFGISTRSIYNKANKLGIDTKKIGLNEKEKLKESFSEVSKLKKNASVFEQASGTVQTAEISNLNGSTVEQRLEIEKKRYDNLNRTIAKYQLAIDTYGDVFINEANGQPYANPVQKSLNEAYKQSAVINKTINELEEKLKYSILASSQESAIDD